MDPIWDPNAPEAYSHVSSSKVQFGLSSSGKRKSLMTDVARLNLGLARRMDSAWSRNKTNDGKPFGCRRSASGSCGVCLEYLDIVEC